MVGKVTASIEWIMVNGLEKKAPSIFAGMVPVKSTSKRKKNIGVI
jgi:hypothetical protein